MIVYKVYCYEAKLRWRRKDDESDRGDDHIHSFLAPLLCLCALSVGRRGHRLNDGSTRHLSDQHTPTPTLFTHCVSCMDCLFWWALDRARPVMMISIYFYAKLDVYWKILYAAFLLSGTSCTIMLLFLCIIPYYCGQASFELQLILLFSSLSDARTAWWYWKGAI